MKEKFVRTGLLLGEEGLCQLEKSHVAVFGVGGVGGYVVEALVRSGIGEITIVDKDEVAESNINRQIIATTKTIGMPKVDVMAQRIADINPECVVHKYACFYLPETADQFDFTAYDYVVDAVDTVTAKLEIILQAKTAGVPVISSMGAGNKLDPARFEVADIYKTSVCPLARVMRRELKKRNVDSLKVVYSKEEPVEHKSLQEAATVQQGEVRQAGSTKEQQSESAKVWQSESTKVQQSVQESPEPGRRSTPGSIAFVPSVAGLILAGEVVRDLSAC